MNASAAEPRISERTAAVAPNDNAWSQGRWVLTIALIFGVQLGLIFALGDRKPPAVRQPAFVPRLSLAAEGIEWLALNDPTLFALPHASGFSGAAWMRTPRVEPAPFVWTELPQWLAMPVAPLASAFSRFMETNRFVEYSPELKSSPRVTMPERLPVEAAPEFTSGLRVAGDLAGRKLLNPPLLTAQPAADMLANTTVQLLVDDDGRVISAVLLTPAIGQKEVDQLALGIAKSTRFEALPRDAANSGNPPRWTGGRMIFQWRTEPAAQTNSAVLSP